MRDNLIGLAAGTAGGALGTLLMQTGIRHGDKLPEAAQPPQLSQDPGQFMVERAEEKVGRALPKDVEQTAARALHWAYGTGFGAALGFLAPYIRARRFGRALGAGAGLGVLVWAVGYLGWLPASGLTRPVHRERPGGTATSLLSHVLYGMVSALPIYAAERFRPRQRRGWRRLLAWT
jgi:hypothetical protein